MTTVGNKDAVHLLHVEYEVGACCVKEGFSGGSNGKKPACNVGAEKAMATHSSVLAWRIPGTAEPGGLPSMGSHRVGHD